MKRNLRFFNKTGPCNPDDHYMLPPEERLVGMQLDRYIKDKLYWVLHAPRQMGKTTFLQSWMRQINDSGEAVACYVTLERCQGVSEPERSMPAICDSIIASAKTFEVPIPERPILSASNSILRDVLQNWSELVAPKPLIILFDEVDTLVGDSLISFLRQLRDGFASRGVGKFPISVGLVGMRDLRDYITSTKGGIAPNPGSPFNIKEDSAELSYFTKNDVIRLFAQRTAENGQQITDEAIDYVFEQSGGHPWIVNSLFVRATIRILGDKNTETVTLAHVQEAREQMMKARETHLDALIERLKEDRIRRVIQAIMLGETDVSINNEDPDVMLATDLGLIKWDIETGFRIANPIYTEILTRCLNNGYHDYMPSPSSWRWQTEDGRLDMDALLREFQDFWRNNSEVWEQWTQYTEAFPHLLLMAFMQRLINSGGRIEREYATGRGRMDLAVEYKGEWHIIEIKLLRKKQTFERVKAEGLKQIERYRNTFVPPVGCHKNLAGSYLVIFDRRPVTTEEIENWDERIGWEIVGEINVVSC